MKRIKCLITAGPTREYFDPVRYISNPSTGKMGWAIAEASKEFGWDTTLVLGPSSLPDIDGVNVERVVSADDMLCTCKKYFADCDILIMSLFIWHSCFRTRRFNREIHKLKQIAHSCPFVRIKRVK